MVTSMARRLATTTSRTGRTAVEPLSPARRRLGTLFLMTGLAATAGWLGWRIVTLGAHPVQVVSLLVELSGWTGGTVVAVGMLRSTSPRDVLQTDDTYRYAHAVADRVGRTRAADLHSDLWAAVERLGKRTAGDAADRAMIGVLIDGPRRIALVTTLLFGLLLGVSPAPMPPVWAVSAVALGTVLIASAHVVASNGRIRFGDRTRWSSATLGEVLSPVDRADVAPRRWVGTVGTVVVLNLGIALRGMSDRWTHGLPSMPDDERIVVMTWAGLIVLGGLYTLRTTPTPRLGNAHLVARRLEERTARQSALGAAVCLGLIGLLAGVLPGSVDAGANDPARIEPTTQIEADGRGGG